ncbi:paraquat-inducible protein A [Sulfurovum sp.]|uniref:paraquat-inducible protein A n=1 Tax=Sulfurovum sp. TaxID=1969726 RepID=UPI002867CA74|nr:paraquat-inducible protein A [Sulfurovum sp.]
MIYTITHLIETGKETKILKVDYEQLHSLQYGLLNSNVWTEKISAVFRQKIDEFDFTSTSREEIKKYVETVIDTLIVEADKTVRRKNESKRGFFKSLLGDTKQMITDELVDIRNLRKKVPQYTDAVMNELEKPANQKILKAVMKDKLHQFMKTNLAPVDMSGYNQILEVYQCNDFETCSTLLDAQLKQRSEELNLYTIAILSMAVILIILILLQGTILKSISLLLLSVTSIALLIAGLFLPMLDIEAKINKLYFIILEKPLTFTDQVIFFKSKSISDLAQLLLESDEIKMIFVGVLLVMFSIIFPTLKLISTYLYFYSRSFIGNNAIVRFFALRSTKWSMADVMVVSIFMAYLGLDSMIENELKKLVEQSAPVNVITSNGTDLQVGFFLFLGFVFTSFVLSILVENSRKSD